MFKCNLNVLPDKDRICVDKDSFNLLECDLYCFEASLFKHWLDINEKERIILSYGFLLPYNDLGWNENSPRVRLSQRIWKKFINGKTG